MSTSQKTLDSISIEGNAIYTDVDTIGVILQNSIRYEKFKQFAVYRGQQYLGIFECCTKSVYTAEKFPEPLARLVFGSHTKAVQTILNNIHRKGLFSPKSEFCLIVLFRVGYDKKHEIKNARL